MGFGYLFVGYLLTASFVYESLTLLPALLIMWPGLRRLRLYNQPLREAAVWLYPLTIAAGASFVTEVLRMTALIGESVHTSVFSLLSPLSCVLMLFFHERLLSGIGLLAQETGLDKLHVRARRNRFFSLFVFGLTAILYLPIHADWFMALNAAAFLPVLVCRFITVILNAVLIYSAYMWICTPDDLDMKRKKTGIGWLDKFNEENDRRDEEKTARKKQELADIYHAHEKKYREKQNQKRTRK